MNRRQRIVALEQQAKRLAEQLDDVHDILSVLRDIMKSQGESARTLVEVCTNLNDRTKGMIMYGGVLNDQHP